MLFQEVHCLFSVFHLVDITLELILSVDVLVLVLLFLLRFLLMLVANDIQFGYILNYLHHQN